MLINKITLSNFRQYKNTQTILFSCDPEKNVTVILGDNTSGKTTLIQAFNWCLYNNTTFKTKELLNEDTFQYMPISTPINVFVEVELTHEGRIYVIKRSQTVIKNEVGTAICKQPVLRVEYKEPNGEMQAITPFDCQSTVNKILPEALSSYFFFDGEHISDINEKGNVKAAVRGLMGLETINEAVDHLNPAKPNSVISKLQHELDPGQDRKAQQTTLNLISAKESLEKLQDRLAKINGEIEYFERRGEDLRNKILEHKDTKNKMRQKTDLEKDISYLTGNQISIEQRLISDFTKNAYKFFAFPLYAKVQQVLSDANTDTEGIPKMHSDSIDFILKRGRCICGADLCNNTDAIEHIKHEQSLLPPQHIGTTIHDFKSDCSHYMRDIDGFAKLIMDDYIRIRENANQIDEKKSQMEELSKELIGDIDVGKFETESIENANQLKAKKELALQLASEIGATKNQIQSLEATLNSLTLSTEKNRRVSRYIAYATEIYKWFKESYDEKEKAVKNELYSSINSLFSQMYHGNRIVEVDDNYRISLKVRSSASSSLLRPDTSPGLDTVKNFAFIAGIVDLARKKAKSSSDFIDDSVEYSTEPYPIVMDAPFSNADETHIARISKVLPQVAEQVILVVMNKDWEYAKTNMSDKVGTVYQIVKQSEIESVLKRSSL